MKDIGIKVIRVFFVLLAVAVIVYMAFIEANPSSVNVVTNYLLLVNISVIAYILTSFKLGNIQPLICFKLFPLKTYSVLRYRLGDLVKDKLWFVVFIIAPLFLLFNSQLSLSHSIFIIILTFLQLFISIIIMLGLWDRFYLKDEEINNRLFLIVPAIAGLNSFIQDSNLQFLNPFGGISAFLYKLIPIFGYVTILIIMLIVISLLHLFYKKFTEYIH